MLGAQLKALIGVRDAAHQGVPGLPAAAHLYLRSVPSSKPSSGSGISRVVPWGAVTAKMVSVPVLCMRTMSSLVTNRRALLLGCSVMLLMVLRMRMMFCSSSRLSSCAAHTAFSSHVWVQAEDRRCLKGCKDACFGHASHSAAHKQNVLLL